MKQFFEPSDTENIDIESFKLILKTICRKIDDQNQEYFVGKN